MKLCLLAVSIFSLVAACGGDASNSPDASAADSGSDPIDGAIADAGDDDPGTDTDGDGIPDDEDICTGDNSTGDFDHDGVCDGQFLAAEPCIDLTLDEEGSVTSGPGVAFSPDGTRIAVISGKQGSPGPALTVYGACGTPEAGEVVAQVDTEFGGFNVSYAVAWSDTDYIALFEGRPNEYFLMIYAFDNGALNLTAELLTPTPTVDMDQVVWAPGMERLVAIGADNLWMARFPPEIFAARPSIKTDSIGGVDFDPDGECIWYIGSDSEFPDVWHACLEDDRLAPTPELEMPGYAIDVSPDGDMLALSTVGGPRAVRKSVLLEGGTLAPATASYHPDEGERVGSIVWHPAGTYIAASGSEYFYIMAYDRQAHALVMRAQIPQPTTGSAQVAQGAAFSPDGDYLAIRSSGSFRVYPVTKAE